MQSGTRYLHSIWNRYLQVLEKTGIVKSIKGLPGRLFLKPSATGDYRFFYYRSFGKVTTASKMRNFRKKENIPGVSKQSRNWVIDRVNDSVTEILQSVTLHDLEKEYQEYIDYGQDMYYI